MEELYSRISVKAIASVVLGGALLSLSPFLVEMSEVNALTSTFYRLLIGAASLFVIGSYQNEEMPDRSNLLLCLIAASAIALDLVVWNQSVLYIGPGISTVLANLEIVFLILIGCLVYQERLSPRFLLLCGWIFVGIGCLLYPLLHQLDRRLVLGVLLGLGASFIYSIYLLVLKLMGAKNSNSTTGMLCVICFFAMLAVGASMLFIPSASFAIPHLKALLCLLASGTLCQTCGWILIVRGLKNVSLSITGLLMLVQPALTFLLDCFVLGRNNTWIQISGCLILLGTVYLVTLEEKRSPS